MQCFMAEELTKLDFTIIYQHFTYVTERSSFSAASAGNKAMAMPDKSGNVKVQLLGTDRDESSFCYTSGDFGTVTMLLYRQIIAKTGI